MELDLDKIVRLLNEEYKIESYVGQTGGGTATLLIGEEIGDRYELLAGPGWFEGPGWTNGRATNEEFYIGPDDDGATDPYVSHPDWDEAKAALHIAMALEELRGRGCRGSPTTSAKTFSRCWAERSRTLRECSTS